MTGTESDIDRVHTRADFARELTLARELSGLTVRELAVRLSIPSATLGGYFGGRHLPSASQLPTFIKVLGQCRITEPDEVKRWVAALARARTTSDGRLVRSPAPYRGLEPFQPEDAENYFGRQAAIDLILDGLRHSAKPLLMVVGASGSGKSSVLRAGVIPAVRAGALGPPSSCALMTPGSDPLGALTTILSSHAPRLLVIDQFEELFTSSDTPAQRKEFLDQLSQLDPRQTLVAAGLRADFYAAASREPTLVGPLQGAQVVIAPMSATELRQAIVEPARRSGSSVDEALVEVLLRDLGPRGTADYAHDPGALPLLSHALLATWARAPRNQLTVEDYHAIGGINGAVQQTAEEIFNELDPAGQECARRLFHRLVNVEDDTIATRRRVDRAELDGLTDPNDENATLVSVVIARFVGRRLLTTDVDTVAVSHEALLSVWPRLREWLDEDRAGLRLHRQLTNATRVWAGGTRDPSTLLRGASLDAAAAWAGEASNDAELNRVEREFLESSLTLRSGEQRAVRRRTRRLRQLVTAIAILAVLAGVLAVSALHATATADSQRAQASQARDQAMSREIALEVTRTRVMQPALAMQLALAAYRIAPTPQARAALLDSSALPSATRIIGPVGPMQSLAVSSNGRLLAATGADGRVHLWSLSDLGHPVALPALGLPAPSTTLFAVAFSPDSTIIAAGGSDHLVRLWDVSDPTHPRVLGAPLTGPSNTVFALAFSPDGMVLAAGSADKTVHLWNVDDRNHPLTLRPLIGATSFVQTVAFSPDGRSLAAGTASGQIRIWSLAHQSVPVATSTLDAPGETAVFALAFSPDGHTLAAGGRDDIVHRWELRDGRAPKPQPNLTGFTSWVNALAFSPDGRTLAAGSSDSTTILWNLATGSTVRTLAHASAITALAFLPDGRTLATASNNGVANLWPVHTPALQGPQGTVYTVAYDKDGKRLAVGSGDSHVELWDTSGTPRMLSNSIVSTSPGLVLDGAVAISPDGSLVAAGSGSKQGAVELWDVRNPGKPRLLGSPLTGPTDTDESLVFSADGKTLAAASDDKTVHLWNISDPNHPQALPTLTGFTNYVYSIAFSPDGTMLAAPDADKTVELWDIRDPNHPVHKSTISGFTSYVYAVAYTPDGRTLAAASADKTVRLFNVSEPSAPKQLGATLTGPTDYLLAIAISPDGHTLAASGQDGGVWLWDIRDRDHPTFLGTLTASQGSLFTLTFAPDGHALAAAGSDHVVYRWSIDPKTVAAQVCSSAGDAITAAEWREYVPGARYHAPCP